MNAALIKVSLQHGNWFILPAQWYEAAKPKGKRAVSISGLSYTQTPSLGPQGTRMPEHSPQRVFRTRDTLSRRSYFRKQSANHSETACDLDEEIRSEGVLLPAKTRQPAWVIPCEIQADLAGSGDSLHNRRRDFQKTSDFCTARVPP